jgi:filamentous hemagglutinin family protein
MRTSFGVRGGVFFSLPAALLAPFAQAAPADGIVRAGAATIAQSANATTITQTSSRAVIDWRSFDIGAGESVTFAQPNAQAAVLNRVTGTQFSSLQGSLSANGQVFLVNPNGILIGNGAAINVGSFFASTANIATPAFMSDPASVNGRYAFDELTTAARTSTIVNAGSITVADAGMVALVAPGVRNTGTIVGRLGTIELASATHFTLDLYGDDLVRLALDDSIAGALVDSSGATLQAQVGAAGQLTADGGRVVLLSVPAAAGVVSEAINLSGVARAQSVGVNGRGEISLLANSGVVTVSGGIDAASNVAGALGGEISLMGGSVHLTSAARVNASGIGGGGTVVIGGKLAGIGANATTQTTVDSGALVWACGTATCAADGTGGAGDGGTIRVFSTQGTSLGGELNASSGAANRAGTMELISDNGVTSMSSMARIIGITGQDQLAGFAAIIGNSLDLAPTAFVNMSDIVGNLPLSTLRLIGDSLAPATTRLYVFDPGTDPRQTDNPILFHAYNGDLDYPNHLPALFAAGFEGPVGALRPNGGTPTTFASTGVDTLVAIPVSFTPPAPPAPVPGVPTVPGADNVTAQLANTANGLARDAAEADEIIKAGQRADDDTAPMGIVSGGRGVAQVADLGRSGAVAGASPDVFGANFHVLAPAGGGDDVQVSDYLCLTPFAKNSCD